jgi:hypothetical protein
MLSSNNHVLSDSFKVTVLDQAVQQIEDLRQVRITYSTFCLQLKIPSSFQGYFELLHKAATAPCGTQASNPTRKRSPLGVEARSTTEYRALPRYRILLL